MNSIDLDLNVAEEIEAERSNLAAMIERVLDQEQFDRAWGECIEIDELRFNDWDLETEYATMVNAYNLSYVEAERYYAQKIYNYKLESGSFADPIVRDACQLLKETFL